MFYLLYLKCGRLFYFLLQLIYGAPIPYSQAANPEYAEPKFDSQQDVHLAVLELINDAIENFKKGQTFASPTNYDFTFNADVDKWIAAAPHIKK